VNFIKLYIGDYLRDTGTLTVAEHGAYVLMLLHHYGTESPLPVGRELHRLLRAESKADREAIDRVAARFWTATDSGLVNNRAGREMARAEHQREVNRTVGKLGGRPKRTETDSVSDSLTDSQPNHNPNQTPDTRHQKETPPNPRKRGQVSEFPPGFDRFWQAYPRKEAKPTAAKGFARLKPDEPLLAVMLAAVDRQSRSEQWTKDGGQFIPLPATWINGRRWEDEPVSSPAVQSLFAGAI
jgi:uncharacterized protein YdaU (DUF1376 family)